MPHRVVAVAYQHLATFEFGIAVEFFGLPRPEFPVWYEFRSCSVEPGPVAAVGGVTVGVSGGLGLLRSADTIVVPGWPSFEEDPPERLLRALRRAHARGARMVSFCSGAFLLGAAGLLDGRRATTHWRFSETLARRFPEVTVDADVLYVDDGSILTSAGSASAIDLCLHIVRQDFGTETANQVARRLVVPPHREGGQSQFIETAVEPKGGSGSLVEAMGWARAHLASEISVHDLASRAGMSPRTFARRFRSKTGTTPHRWLVRQRVLAAQDLLESSELSVEEVASSCGFGSPLSLRQHFRRMVNTSPTAYRRAFAGFPTESG